MDGQWLKHVLPFCYRDTIGTILPNFLSQWYFWEVLCSILHILGISFLLVLVFPVLFPVMLLSWFWLIEISQVTSESPLHQWSRRDNETILLPQSILHLNIMYLPRKMFWHILGAAESLSGQTLDSKQNLHLHVLKQKVPTMTFCSFHVVIFTL